MGGRKPFKPQRWTASALTALMNCPWQFFLRYVDFDRPLLPELPILVAGTVAHEAVRVTSKPRKGFTPTPDRRLFCKTPESFHGYAWWLWGKTVKKKEDGRGIRWEKGKRKEQFGGLGSYIARVLTGLEWVGPKGQRELKPADSPGYFQMVHNPRVPFELVAVEREIKALFEQYQLVARVDQIWRVEPCEELPDGGIVIVDLTLGRAIKHVQLTMYSLALRLAALQNGGFRQEMFGVERREEFLKEEAVAVLSLSQAELYIFRRSPEDYERLAGWLDWASSVVVSGQYEPTPTDAVCGRCEYSYDCRFAATTEVLGLEKGGAYVVVPLAEPPLPIGRQLGFAGWQRGAAVRQGRRTVAFVLPAPTTVGEVA